jgi:hypothetical protein
MQRYVGRREAIMSDNRWPDPERPGVPMNPTRSGPHLIADQHGRRRWAWWMTTETPHGGSWIHEGGGSNGLDWGYIGPAQTPDGLPAD